MKKLLAVTPVLIAASYLKINGGTKGILTVS